jgi:hypothetical protein
MLLIFTLVSAPSASEDPLEVSLLALIADPAAFEGRLVRVKGFLKLEFEGTALYLHEDDYLHGLSKNGVWVEVTRDSRECGVELDSTYVVLVGVFRDSKKGHFAANSGGLTQLRRCDFLSDPNYPIVKSLDERLKRRPQKP